MERTSLKYDKSEKEQYEKEHSETCQFWKGKSEKWRLKRTNLEKDNSEKETSEKV